MEIDGQDLIDFVVSQRNDALNAVAQANALLKACQRRIAALEEASKADPKPE